MPNLAPQRFKIQFTANQEYVDLLEKATELLPHAVRSRALEEVHLRAMRLLVAELEKRRYGAPKSPRAQSVKSSKANEPVPPNEPTPNEPAPNEPTPNEPAPIEPAPVEPAPADATDGDGLLSSSSSQRPNALAATAATADQRTISGEKAPRRRGAGRYIPVEARRAVRERDGGRCTYVDADGRRCRETSCLEVHHLDPYSRGGPPTAENLTLRCRPHNALAGEQDFGRAHMQRMKRRD